MTFTVPRSVRTHRSVLPFYW